ncbi:MAG: ribosome silencing factor [Caldicoprobacterales bacterium]|nr:ribosome silencing factor [Clostridiales bacterium]
MNNPQKLAQEIADILDEKKAENVVVLDISRLTTLADYFVIASGRSELQVSSLTEELQEKMAEKGISLRHMDRGSRWVALDYNDIIVHIFHYEERAFYNLERLWSDAERVSSNSTD